MKTLPIFAPPAVNYTISFAAAATTGADISHGCSGRAVVVFKTTQDCFLVFGPDAAMGVADSGDMLLQAQDGWVAIELNKGTHFLSVIRSTADGVLHYYLPGQA